MDNEWGEAEPGPYFSFLGDNMPRTFGKLWPLAAFFMLALLAAPAWGGEAPPDKAQVPPPAVPDDGFQAGREYDEVIGPVVLFEPDDGRIEVLSYFWYNCGACYRIDAEMHEWAAKLPADVHLVRLPAAFNPVVNFHARIYLTLRAMGLGFEADQTIFNLFQKERKPVNQPEQLAELARVLKVDKNKLLETFNSPEIEAQLARVEKSMDDYSVPGVPAMVIDGRYRFDIGTAHGPEGYKKLAEFLIDKRRLDRQKEKGSKPAKK